MIVPDLEHLVVLQKGGVHSPPQAAGMPQRVLSLRAEVVQGCVHRGPAVGGGNSARKDEVPEWVALARGCHRQNCL